LGSAAWLSQRNSQL